jgi:predicted metal-dependent HD superfamily phosphohydrolase
MEEELRARWAAVAGSGGAAEAAYDGLVERYREPHRHYHGLPHVLRVLRTVDELLAQVAVDDPTAVRFAAWFHDAVYDPRSADNEAASAALARQVLTELDQPPATVARVSALVEATADHQPSSADEAVLVDADLAVLAGDPATYEAYARGVRREYAHVDDDGWRVGRAAVLRSLLERPRLFTTDPATTWEARARANLTAELAGLTPA